MKMQLCWKSSFCDFWPKSELRADDHISEKATVYVKFHKMIPILLIYAQNKFLQLCKT